MKKLALVATLGFALSATAAQADCGIGKAIDRLKQEAVSNAGVPSEEATRKLIKKMDRDDFRKCDEAEMAALQELIAGSRETSARESNTPLERDLLAALDEAARRLETSDGHDGGTVPADSNVDQKMKKRAERAAKILKKALVENGAFDSDVQDKLFDKARCLVVIPKFRRVGLFGWGASWGKGLSSCRDDKGSWTLPQFMSVKEGSFGPQFGGAQTDLLMLVYDRDAASDLDGTQVTFGGEAAAVFGPWGRVAGADTNIKLGAKILTYSKSKGFYFGLVVEGGTLKVDKEANERVYGPAFRSGKLDLTREPIREGDTLRYSEIAAFVDALERVSMSERK